PGEALLRVLCAGICGTDLALLNGYLSFAGIPGHEFVGRVEAAPGEAARVGRRVVGEINLACHRCAACLRGDTHHCAARQVLGLRGRAGAFAEFLTLPIENLHAVPDALPDEAAVFTEPTAAALEIQEQVTIGRGDRVVVIGPGRLGQLVARTLALTGCELRLIGRHSEPPPEREADVVVECSGHPDGLAAARRAVRPRGTIVLKSTYASAVPLDIASIVVDEVTLVGSRCGPFPRALELLSDGRVDVRPLVHARYPLSEALAAFEHAARPGTLKVLVRP
ncbi:MAG TPA: alcohol dehydrogenase catalytic domain-containing protein, partial [Vicinamibacteria bacterium]